MTLAERSDGFHGRPQLAEPPMRVLHAPVNVGNQPWVLSRHERKLGVQSDLIVNYTTLGYAADKILSKIGDDSIESMSARFAAAIQAPVDYDVIHYYFGRTLLDWDDYQRGTPFRYLDLDIAKTLGLPIIYTLQGCDVRLAAKSNRLYKFTPCQQGACSVFESCLSYYDKSRQAFIDAILPRADKVFYLNPELGRYLPRGEFLPYSSVEIDEFSVIPPVANRRPIILHAPTNSSTKGTPRILAALETLRDTYDFEVVLVQGKTHQEALALYQQADLVIDQVLYGWYGGFAVEAMAMGKPVLCYLREEDFDLAPPELLADCPIVNIHPDRLVEDIGAVFERRSEWAEWSRRSREFVERWHDPDTIARAMVEVYKNPSAPFRLAEHARERIAG
jgi:glycosyltransferase involved in cell wall biosynthesis